MKQAFLLVIDVPAGTAATIVFITLWRARVLFLQLQAVRYKCARSSKFRR